MSDSRKVVISVKVPILWESMSDRDRTRLTRITGRDTRVIRAFLGVIARHEKQLLVGKRKKKINGSKLEKLTLTAESLTPDLILDLSSSVLNPGEMVTLYVTDVHDPGTVLLPGVWYIITITSVHDESAQDAEVRVLVGGRREYLPLILKHAPRDWQTEGSGRDK